jgi:hypothetical protein
MMSVAANRNATRSAIGRRSLLPATVALCVVSLGAQADGFSVDKVYHPYVQPLEREIEYRALYLNDDNSLLDGTQVHRLGFGRSFNDRLFGEVYLIGAKLPGESLELEAYEIELKWQLTEQGEYFADWGLLFELEAAREQNIQEFATSVLVEKEFGRWAGTLNLSAIYEWGSDISNEWESALAAQMRYRYSPAFEPAIELYSGEIAKGVGPVALGDLRFNGGRKLHWEAGVIVAVDSESPDQTWRFLLEYEF